jgi:hypothetical protein
MHPNQISLLNSLKGAASCMLWALVFSGKPLHRTDLVVATGYQRDTVTKGLQTLEALHLVERIAPYQGWRLTTRLEQLDLSGLFEDASYGEAESSNEGEAQEDLDEGEEDEFGEAVAPACSINSSGRAGNLPSCAENTGWGAKYSPSPAESSRQEAKKSPSPVKSIIDVVEIQTPNSKRINQIVRTSTTTEPAGAEPLNLAAGLDPRVLKAFRSAGLVLNPRTRALALMPHITPQYVSAHYAQLKASGNASHTGLLITLLEAGIPAPETYPNGHLKTCTCDVCSYRYRYLSP